MQIDKNCVVSLQFKLTNSEGELLDSSPDDAPLVYLHGGAGILPALESALAGRSVGESFSVTITPDEGYGQHQPGMVQKVPISAFPDRDAVKPGTQFSQQSETGEMPVMITAVEGDTVTIDANHPLAGMTLIFEGTIADIRPATEAEVGQGYPGD